MTHAVQNSMRGGGKTIDFPAPMRGVFRKMGAAESAPGVLATS